MGSDCEQNKKKHKRGTLARLQRSKNMRKSIRWVWIDSKYYLISSNNSFESHNITMILQKILSDFMKNHSTV